MTRTAVGLALVVLAAAAALFAEDARRRPGQIDRGAVAPARVDGLLGLDDDVAFRGALQLVRRVRASSEEGVRSPARVRLVGLAQTALARIETSPAANLLGYLYYEGAAGQLRLAQPSLEAFRRAVRLDGTNDDAKFNLELLLAQLSRVRVTQPQFEVGRGRGRVGATVVPRGSGY